MDDRNPLLDLPDALNPYRVGLGFVKKQLLWDLKPAAWRSRKALKALRDSQQGRKAVILCNGPSLLKVDFDALSASGAYCFGLNKINLLFDKTAFRPQCIVAVNHLVIDQNAAFYNETSIPLFLDTYALGQVRPRSNVVYIPDCTMPRFARDCSMSVYAGNTVTNVALQLAFHMGFAQVALVGADHNFATKGPANKAVVSGEKDESHFDPNYFAGGVQWHLPDLFQSEVSYTMARDMYEACGRRVYNCTDGGKLEIFERKPLDSFLRN